MSYNVFEFILKAYMPEETWVTMIQFHDVKKLFLIYLKNISMKLSRQTIFLNLSQWDLQQIILDVKIDMFS